MPRTGPINALPPPTIGAKSMSYSRRMSYFPRRRPVLGMHRNHTIRALRIGLLCGALCWVTALAAQTTNSSAGLAYIGTLDKKLLIYDENKEEVVGEIPLQGIPRQTALTRDQSTLVILTADMAVDTVDLKARKMTKHFELADGRSK